MADRRRGINHGVCRLAMSLFHNLLYKASGPTYSQKLRFFTGALLPNSVFFMPI